jgi:hypothetical protein
MIEAGATVILAFDPSASPTSAEIMSERVLLAAAKEIGGKTR